MRVARASPPVSHLLFADDSLFFCKAEPRECDEVIKILQVYGTASGQCINFEKSSLLFGKRIPDDLKAATKNVTGIHNEGGMGTYLGIPEDISGSKCKLFAFIKERLQGKANGWSAKKLSRGGKEVLIKSIALALPSYVMSSFLLPLDICEKLASAIARFWWSSNPPRRGMHWVKWEKMCLPRDKGGIGFRAIHEFNLALLGKQFWRLLQFPNSLLARVLKGRYYKNSSPLRQTSIRNPSYGWRSILASKPLISLGIRQKIHSGLTTKAWEDPWIPSDPPRPARASAPVVHPAMTVSDFISQETLTWDLTLLDTYLAPEEVSLVLSLAISKSNSNDTFCWNHTKTGQYTVKSGYWVARNLLNQKQEVEYLEPSIRSLQAHAWKVRAPQKMKHLLWQVVSGYLAVTKNLIHRGLRCDNVCPRCGKLEESINHAIFKCPQALQTWELALPSPSSHPFPSAGVYTNIDFLFWRIPKNGGPDDHVDSYPWIIWFLWKARNDKLFRGITREPNEIFSHAISECIAWSKANSESDATPSMSIPPVPLNHCFRDICLVDGSWTQDGAFSGVGWVWYGEDCLKRSLGLHNLPRRLSPLHSELDALMWAMQCMLDRSATQAFGTDCQDVIKMTLHPEDWPSFSTELHNFADLRRHFPEFSLTFVPRSANSTADSLAKIARSSNVAVSYSGYSIPVWLVTPPQV